MKKFLLILLLIIVVVVGGFMAYTATIPGEYTVEREITIDAPASQVYAYVSDLETQQEWSPWSQIDSAMTKEFSESTNTVGATYNWSSENENVGTGSLEITGLTENERVDEKLTFTAPFESESTVYITLEETEEGTKVIWGNKGEMDFMAKIFITMGGGMDKLLGPTFEEGLGMLKEQVEAAPKAETATYTFEVMENTPVAYYSVKREGMNMDTDMNADLFAGMYGEIGAFMGQNGIEMTGAPMAIYHKWDEENRVFDVEGAMPVAETGKESGDIHAGTTHEGMVVKTVHVGPYENGGDAHEAMYAYIMENNYQIVGSVWEVYANDPANVDESELMTEIYYPVMPKTEEAE